MSGFGVASVLLSALLTRGAYAGAAVPLVLLGLLSVAIGAGVYARTDSQVAHLSESLWERRADVAKQEVARMTRVRRAASFLLVFDLVADQRAVVYLEALRLLEHRVD